MKVHCFFFYLTFAIIGAKAVAADLQFSGCFDPIGSLVKTISSDESPWVARAQSIKDTKAVIVLNQKLMKKYSNATKTVIYWHECGHIALAHLLKGTPITPIQEQEADCYGIRTAITIGEVKLEEVTKVQADFASLGPGDWQHLAGNARAVNLKRCLNDGLTEAAFNSCKKRFYANVDVIRKSVDSLKQVKAICKKFKVSSRECMDSRKLADNLHSGILAEIGNLDNKCPYVSDPKFTKWIHFLEDEMLQVKIQK